MSLDKPEVEENVCPIIALGKAKADCKLPVSTPNRN